MIQVPKVKYEELTPSEFRIRIKEVPVAFLPLGTLEWHGEHLPLGADCLQPAAFFQEVAAEFGGIVLPALFFGPDRMEEVGGIEFYGKDNGNHPDLVGQQYNRQVLEGSAYWIPEFLFVALFENILKQLKRQYFKCLVAHGHGPSVGLLLKHASKWESEFKIRIFCLEGAADEDSGFMSDHGAANETSILMNYYPDLVHLENLSTDLSKWPVGIRGKDPRIYASASSGAKISAFHKRWIINKLTLALGL